MLICKLLISTEVHCLAHLCLRDELYSRLMMYFLDWNLGDLEALSSTVALDRSQETSAAGFEMAPGGSGDDA